MKHHLWCLVVLLLLLVGCASNTAVEAEPTTYYQSSTMAQALYHAENAVGENGVKIDLSAVAEGYIVVVAESDVRLKLQVVYGENKYTYNLSSDGEPCVYPLQSGDGQYTVRVLKNVSDSKYMEIYNTQVDVVLESEFEPFLRPSQIVNYTEESACVALATQLAQEAQTETEVVAAVYKYIVENIKYDYEKAQTVADGYLPTPDDTLACCTGICFDYAALAAAMLRSVGIPTQVITGYVQDGAVYHAWNRIYLKDGGWITVQIKAPTRSWQAVDLTFAANGVEEAPVTSDGNYVQRYVY